MSKFVVTSGLGIFTVLATVVAGVIGYVLNIVHLFNADFSHITGKIVVEIAGVVIPVIGAIAGWFIS